MIDISNFISSYDTSIKYTMALFSGIIATILLSIGLHLLRTNLLVLNFLPSSKTNVTSVDELGSR